MKFHIFKIISLLFLIVSVHLTERKHMKRFQKNTQMPAGLSIFANLAFGILEGLGAGNANWQTCLPQNWGIASTSGNVDSIGNSLQSLGQTANQILDIFKSVLDLFCKYKSQIFSVYKGGAQGFSAITNLVKNKRIRFMSRRRGCNL